MNDVAKLLPIIKLRKLSRHKIDIQESLYYVIFTESILQSSTRCI